MDSVKKYKIEKIEKYKDLSLMDEVIVEYPLEIYVNGEKFKRLSLTPIEIENLVIGHLYSENLINSISDIKNLKIEENKVYVDLKKEKSKKRLGKLKIKQLIGKNFLNFQRDFKMNPKFLKEQVELILAPL